MAVHRGETDRTPSTTTDERTPTRQGKRHPDRHALSPTSPTPLRSIRPTPATSTHQLQQRIRRNHRDKPPAHRLHTTLDRNEHSRHEHQPGGHRHRRRHPRHPLDNRHPTSSTPRHRRPGDRTRRTTSPMRSHPGPRGTRGESLRTRDTDHHRSHHGPHRPVRAHPGLCGDRRRRHRCIPPRVRTRRSLASSRNDCTPKIFDLPGHNGTRTAGPPRILGRLRTTRPRTGDERSPFRRSQRRCPSTKRPVLPKRQRSARRDERDRSLSPRRDGGRRG